MSLKRIQPLQHQIGVFVTGGSTKKPQKWQRYELQEPKRPNPYYSLAEVESI